MTLALLIAQALAPLVHAAVDAPEERYPAALAALRRHPDGGNWKKVAEILRAPRQQDVRDRGAITDPAELKKVLARFPWSRGEVRTYALGDDARAFYHLVARAGEGDTVGVYLDLGLGLGQLAEPPPGWAYVQPNWPMVAEMESAGIPMSMTAGRDFQSLVLSILGDLDRHVPVDRRRVYVGGYSRGGNSAWYFGVHWPDRFTGIIPVSGYYSIGDDFLAHLDSVRVLAGVGTDAGHKDSNAKTRSMALLLKRRDHGAVEIFEADGRAANAALAKRAWEWMGEGRGEGEESLPSRVRYVTDDPAHTTAYWVTIEEVKSTGGRRPLRILEPGGNSKEVVYLHRRGASVDAKWEERNRFVLKTSNVKRLVLHLSPEQVDFDRDVEVKLEGKTIRLRAEPTVNRLVANFRRSRRIFPADLELTP